MPPGSGAKRPDALDKTVAFLAKRDGIDKVLKVIRYSTKLLLATRLRGAETELAGRLRDFESSIGTSRKAYRLGKWLADVNAMRRAPPTSPAACLELLASGGEALYYFVEQLTWLVKAGLLDKRHARRFALLSAWAELVGYCGSITLNGVRVLAALDREWELEHELQRRRLVHAAPGKVEEALRREGAELRARRLKRTVAVVQDGADALLALSDVRDGKGLLTSPALLCLAGLVSAAISIHKNWPGG